MPQSQTSFRPKFENIPLSLSESPRILVVDDDPLIRKCLCMALEGEGYQCVEAEDGVPGLQTLANQSVDVIISDNQMPGMTGPEFMKEARKQLREHTPPAILMSGDLDPQLPELARALNFSAFFQKPFDFKSLITKVETLVKPQQASPAFHSIALSN